MVHPKSSSHAVTKERPPNPPPAFPLDPVEQNKMNVRVGRHRRSPVSEFASHKLARYLKYPAMAVGGFICAIALWEVILRFTVESSPGSAIHPKLGKIERAGIMLHSKEGWAISTLNSLGMRSLEPQPKQPGEYRILILGDSYTRADEVSDGLSFSDRLQTALNSSNTEDTKQNKSTPERQIQTINAGKPSASPAGYLYAADFHKQTFEPDSTVVQLTEHDFWIDMNDENSEFYAQKIADGQYEPRYNEHFGSADPLAQMLTERVPGARSLMRMSVLRIGGRNLQGMLSGPQSEPPMQKLSPEEERAIATEDAALVQWTIQQLDQTFPNLVLVFLPAMNYQDADEVSTDPRNAAIETDLENAAAAQGVPLLNMRADFLHHYRSEGTELRGFNNTSPGDGHLNAKGHELVAQRLTDFYQQALAKEVRPDHDFL